MARHWGRGPGRRRTRLGGDGKARRRGRMKGELHSLQRALTRCVRAEGRIARRNARRAFVGALRALRLALDREYPAMAKPPRKPPVYETWPNPVGPARQ